MADEESSPKNWELHLEIEFPKGHNIKSSEDNIRAALENSKEEISAAVEKHFAKIPLPGGFSAKIKKIKMNSTPKERDKSNQ